MADRRGGYVTYSACSTGGGGPETDASEDEPSTPRSLPDQTDGGGETRRGRESGLFSARASTAMSVASSMSEFSGGDQEMEYDLYDCDIGNVMRAPGSLFAPAYWMEEEGGGGDATPTLELELTELFPREATEAEDAVELRGDRGRSQVCPWFYTISGAPPRKHNYIV